MTFPFTMGEFPSVVSAHLVFILKPENPGGRALFKVRLISLGGWMGEGIIFRMLQKSQLAILSPPSSREGPHLPKANTSSKSSSGSDYRVMIARQIEAFFLLDRPWHSPPLNPR